MTPQHDECLGQSSTPSGTHTWSEGHKQLACVLARFMKTHGSTDDASQLAQGCERILWQIFSVDIGQPGTTPNLTAPGVRRRIFELHRQMHGSWKAVFLETGWTNRDTVWGNHIRKLQGAAAQLGLRLALRQKDHAKYAKQIRDANRGTQPGNQPSQGPETPKRATKQFKPVTPQTPEAFAKELSQHTINAELDEYSYESRLKGCLAFRVFSPRSESINGPDGCLPGKWAGKPLLVEPRSSQPFLLEVFNHVTGVKQPSPFLSVTLSFLWAVRMLLRHDDTELLIIDMGEVFKHNTCPSYVTPTNSIVNEMPEFKASLAHLNQNPSVLADPSAPTRKWNCRSELLIWGEIPKSSILSVVSHDHVRRFMTSNPDIDRRLCLSQLGTCIAAHQADSLLRDAKVRVNGKFGSAVGLFTAALRLDFPHAYKLAMSIKRHWVDNRREKVKSARRSPKKSNKRSAINLVFQGGVAAGWMAGWKAKLTTSADLLDTAGNATELLASITISDTDDVREDEENGDIDSIMVISDDDAAYGDHRPGESPNDGDSSDVDWVDLTGDTSSGDGEDGEDLGTGD